MSSSSHEPSHLPTLDGLRGLAAIVVVVSHCANAGFLPSELGRGFGQMGVGLFYGLSGLLMGRLYLNKPFNNATLTDYAWRRGARVIPLYYVVLVVGAILFLGFGVSPYMLDSPGDIVRAAFMIYGTGVLWSIPVEIQFYVVFVAIWYAASRGRLGIALIALLGMQFAIVLAVYKTSGLGAGLSNTYTLAFWLHFFLFGTFIGHLSTKTRFMALSKTQGRGAMVVSVLLLLAGVLAPPGVRDALGLFYTYPFAGPISGGYPLMLLLAGLLNLGALRVFAAATWRWLGKVSYSVYLLHMPVIFAVSAMQLPPLVSAAAVFAGTLILSGLTEHWIEKRAQRAILRRRLGTPAPEPTRRPS